MIGRKPLTTTLLVVLVGLLVAGTGVVVRQSYFGPRTITAYFASATAIYPGDEVRVAGVRVGTIESIEPDGAQARMRLSVDRDVPIPAEAKAVIVAQNLVSARYVQLAPAYETSGPTLPDDAVIGVDRTAVPVEWDEVKEQLTRLATDLGPSGDISTTSVSRFIDSAANAMDGNGDKLRETITQLAQVGRILADGSGDIVDVIVNLQTFVNALRDSNAQIVQFQDRLATVSSVVDSSRSDLDAALTYLAEAVGEVQRFIAGSRDQTAEQIQRLGAVTQNLADNRLALENVLHVAPNAIGNGYNIYNPDTGTMIGGFALANFANPVQLVCSAIGAVKNATAPEASKACAEYLGPALRLLNFNYLPMPFNAYLQKSPSPDNLIYSDPALAPGGAGGAPVPPEAAPAVSAYTGAGDVPPPAGWATPPGLPGAYAPHGLPAAPQPALFPGAPVPPGPPTTASQPTTLEEMLMPAEAPAPPATPMGPS
ncbi:virulence factor Mce family protein [Mycolicibacterium flavescens]|uniref:MCE family protein n=1 Tax=Mycobacterium TaxID=1763 RepID=UPI0007FD8A57|nr:MULTISPECIES: MCE family protein [Mycobacterium]OBB72549.1 mammalian cell entry protein [Mycobacterium sp. 852014-52144_SCH5372336]OBF98605.1 mammalian cell entry protein [Mycobacterium sp. 852002-51152_SCH6134967]VEG40988.1 virulence factor Mce family protein [Mycolicibacterium flavescens]